MTTGCVFNIQHYSVHDGPGIRTIVFLKGCPLHCLWCSNPESQNNMPEIAYNPTKCIGDECRLCLDICPTNAIGWSEGMGLAKINFNRCTECLECGNVCPSKAISIYGKMMSVKEVMDIVEKDMNFYSRSGGGVTFSGGEPLMQKSFLMAALKEAQKRSIHTAIETSGYGDWENIAEIFSFLDYVLIDLKHIDDQKHKRYTGVSNKKILDNLKHLHATFPNKEIHVRTPVIPTFNDTDEELMAIRKFVTHNLPNARYELLKYHSFGRNKYDFIGKQCVLDKTLEISDDSFQHFKDVVGQK